MVGVKQVILITALCGFSSGALAQNPSAESRAAFREAVEDYQMFVVPHCAPDDVSSYVRVRGKRDQAFVQSLNNTELRRDYDDAVADRAEKDRQTFYECVGPPTPPGSSPPDAAQIRAEHEKISRC